MDLFKVHVSLELGFNEDIWMERVFHIPFVPFPSLIIESALPDESTILDEVRISASTSISWSTVEGRFYCFGEWVSGGTNGRPIGTFQEIIAALEQRGWQRK